ncbi:hypothetical protein ACEQ8H_002924 [Pleosporales sp. CAS-2024a]
MPPKKQHQDETPPVKEKLQGSRNPRPGRAHAASGSSLKEADHASVNSGPPCSDSGTSHIKWAAQDTAVLQNYRRAYRIDTPSTFRNPLSHVVLAQGIGRFSPTMAQPKAKRRVHKDHVAMAVRRHFNALGVTEADVIVDWLYTAKHQDKEFRVRFAPQRR